MDAAVVKLSCLAANHRGNRPEPKHDEAEPISAHLFKMTDYPEPSPEWERSRAALRAFADELVVVGGIDLMVEVYDEAARTGGYRAVAGVSAAWSGSHGWWH